MNTYVVQGGDGDNQETWKRRYESLDNEEMDERMLDQSTPLVDGIVNNYATFLGNAPVVVG